MNTHELLAGHLGIAPNNISTWINGNEVRARELVPNRHIKRLTDLYGIPVQWLELASLEEFKMLLYASPLRDGPWQRLLAQAIESDEIHLVHLDRQVKPESQSRGLVADDKDEAVEQVRLGEHVYFDRAPWGMGRPCGGRSRPCRVAKCRSSQDRLFVSILVGAESQVELVHVPGA